MTAGNTYSPGWNSSNPPSSLRGALSISPLSCCSLSDTVNKKNNNKTK